VVALTYTGTPAVVGEEAYWTESSTGTTFVTNSYTMPNDHEMVIGSVRTATWYTLAVSISSGIGGTLSGTPSGSYAPGTPISVVATPDSGWRFIGWGVTGTAITGGVGANPATFAMPAANVTLTAYFLPNVASEYHIIATAGPGGSISPSGVVVFNDTGTDGETFYMTPDSGYHAADVFVDGISIGSMDSLDVQNVIQSHTIYVTFAPNPPDPVTHTIVASAGLGGSISPSGDVVVDEGDNQSFTITADGGYYIADVLVDGVSMGAGVSYTFTNIDADHTIEAVFGQDLVVLATYSITASADAGGSISPAGNVVVSEGNTQAFTITADAGYVIDDVLVDGASVDAVATYTFTNVTANHTISASFTLAPVAPVTYTITASAGFGGTISPSGVVVVNEGADQLFTITPDDGYHIVNVVLDGIDEGVIGSVFFVNVNENHTLSVSFALDVVTSITHTIISSAGGGGSITPVGAVVVTEGADQTFNISPDSGYHVVDVVVDGISAGAVDTYTFTNVTADHTIAVTFALDPVAPATYTITASANVDSLGSITPSGAVVVNEGDNQTFVIKANSGCFIHDVLVDGVSVGAVDSYTFTNVTANHTIDVIFGLWLEPPPSPDIPETGDSTGAVGLLVIFVATAVGIASLLSRKKLQISG